MDLSVESGVVKKFLRQVRFWESKGIVVKSYMISPSTSLCDVLKNANIDLQIFSKNGILNLLIDSPRIFKIIKQNNPDIVYLRFSKYLPGMKYLCKKTKVIAEINTLLENEHHRKSSIGVYIYSLITNNLLLNHVKGFVFLTREIENWYKKKNIKNIVLSDGIDIEDREVKQPQNNTYPKIYFMASNNMPWQGLDKVLVLSKAFPSWNFDVVGISKEEIGLFYTEFPNVRFHDFLQKSEYENIIERCDVALGTLALHRIGMNESSPLKVREYLAYGLPVIIAYKDVDFEGKHKFILQLPNLEDNIGSNLDIIKKFVFSWKGKRINKNQIKHLDSKIKEKVRLDYILSVAKND